MTGAGGSIGSEIVTQVCAFEPERVILFDIDETELHNLGLKLRRLFPQLGEHIVYVTGDVRDEIRLREVFNAWRPQIVFHAAAYKHVPMMEHNPKEAVKVNIFGTFAGRRGEGSWRGKIRHDFDRQGGSPDQRHGRHQENGGVYLHGLQ